ncbi:non-canonical purine NTP pyrophosphatase [Candidatus Woesearchaeota archaeon]|nr:non-canonical purine NTP pyrophosphatase [Candidatus Woesearchaeota archaeon]
MAITLVTGNANKISEFRRFFDELDVLNAEYPELRSDDPAEVAGTSAKALSENLGGAVVVEDSGLFIVALKDFPGTCTKYVTGRIGNRGILRLMKGVSNRKCFYKSAIGYCEPGNQPVCFIGVEEGRVAMSERGKYGWGNDSIFVPKGKNRTYAELKSGGEPGRFRVESIKKLKEFLASRDN